MDSGLYLTRPDGRDLRELGTGPVGSFSWSSDGSRITFVRLAGLDDGTGQLSWISLPDGDTHPLGIATDLSFSVRDIAPSAPTEGEVAPSLPVDAGPSEPAPTAVPSGSPTAVTTPVFETPPSALPADATGTMSALIYSKFRLGCRDAYRLDLATGASTSVAGCQDEVSPDGQRVGSPDGEGLIVSDPNGSATVRVDGPADASPLAWSPDSRWLAWTGAQDPATGRPTQAGVVSADGSLQIRLPTPDASWEPPSWSPDGSHVAISTVDGLLVGDADGSQLKLIGSYPRPLDWAPDGGRIAYLQGGDLWIANVDGTEPRNLTRFEFGGATAAAWSPDGGSVAVIQGRTLWFVSLFGSRHGVDLGMDLASTTGQLSWAPSGGVLAVGMETDRTSAIDLVSSDGTRVVRIDAAASPSWSQDSRFIAFRARDPRAAGIGVANADGTGRRTWTIDGNVSVFPIRWVRWKL